MVITNTGDDREHAMWGNADIARQRIALFGEGCPVDHRERWRR